MCLLLSLLSAVLLGVIYLFFGAFPLVFGENYGFNLWQTGLSFMGIFVGMATGAATNPIWHCVHCWLVRRNHGVPEPEFRLASSILGAVIVPVGLFWFAWTSYPSVHWILPIIGSAVYGCGTLLVFNGIFTFLGTPAGMIFVAFQLRSPRVSERVSMKMADLDFMIVDTYPLYAASALAANSFLRCIFAGEWILPIPTSKCTHFFFVLSILFLDGQLTMTLLLITYSCIPLVWQTAVSKPGIPVGVQLACIRHTGSHAVAVCFLLLWEAAAS